MRNVIFALIGLAALAACGVDGEPVQPTLNAGVGVGDSGVHVGGAVGLHKGPVSVYLGF
ncbi:hypothetical protein [Leisingera daeponensis]|uniref:hypothetical protein n=1 Tax=Leisingera daeponensis TaxID=405746 RepID=UPI000403CEF9|nr:hypothetical protein [Leisingera daeponensis]